LKTIHDIFKNVKIFKLNLKKILFFIQLFVFFFFKQKKNIVKKKK